MLKIWLQFWLLCYYFVELICTYATVISLCVCVVMTLCIPSGIHFAVNIWPRRRPTRSPKSQFAPVEINNSNSQSCRLQQKYVAAFITFSMFCSNMTLYYPLLHKASFRVGR